MRHNVDIRAAFDSALPFPQEPLESHRYVVGYDPGSHDSMLVVLDATEMPYRVVSAECVNTRTMQEQIDVVTALVHRYNNAHVPADAPLGSTSSALCRELWYRGVATVPISLNREKKQRIFDYLSALIEQGNVLIPPHPPFWDSSQDPLMALALACWQSTVDQSRPTGVDLKQT